MATSNAEGAVQEELQTYLTEKGVNTLFIKIVEALLIDKPDSPVPWIVEYLMRSFPEETVAFKKSSAPDTARSDKASGGFKEIIHADSDEEDSDEESGDEEGMGEMVEFKPKEKKGRRISVSASVIDPSKQQLPNVVNPKTEEEHEHLLSILGGNWLCQHLDNAQSRTVVDAMEKMTVEAGKDIISQGDENAEHYFVLDEGEAAVFKDGTEILQYSAGAGFGELALMYNAPRAATVRATADCVVWRLDQVTFKVILMGSSIQKREKYQSFLHKVPILAEMAEYERMVLADALTEVEASKGDVIVTQGDAGDEFFIISEGTLDVTRDGKLMSELATGNYFGEIALLTSKNRQATVTVTSEKALMLKLHRKVFQRVLGPLSDILKRNMGSYSQLVEGVKI